MLKCPRQLKTNWRPRTTKSGRPMADEVKYDERFETARRPALRNSKNPCANYDGRRFKRDHCRSDIWLSEQIPETWPPLRRVSLVRKEARPPAGHDVAAKADARCFFGDRPFPSAGAPVWLMSGIFKGHPKAPSMSALLFICAAPQEPGGFFLSSKGAGQANAPPSKSQRTRGRAAGRSHRSSGPSRSAAALPRDITAFGWRRPGLARGRFCGMGRPFEFSKGKKGDGYRSRWS